MKPHFLFALLLVTTGCATAIIPAKVKYVALYEVVPLHIVPEARGAVASLHTDQLKLLLPGQVAGGKKAPEICFQIAPNQDRNNSPHMIRWQSLPSCGGGAGVDSPNDRVGAVMGGATAVDYAHLLVTFPASSATHPFPSRASI